jgi:hypothetical protein
VVIFWGWTGVLVISACGLLPVVVVLSHVGSMFVQVWLVGVVILAAGPKRELQGFPHLPNHRSFFF